MIVTCPKCKQDGEHAEIYRGCMRPCPHCGELVSLATPDDAPLKLSPIEVCWCGKTRDEHGVDFEVGYLHVARLPWSEYFLPYLGILNGDAATYSQAEFVEGWACEACAFRIRWMEFWPFAAVPMLLLFCLIAVTPLVLKAEHSFGGIGNALYSQAGFLTAFGGLVAGTLAWETWWYLLCAPLKKRFGKGTIVKAKVLEI